MKVRRALLLVILCLIGLLFTAGSAAAQTNAPLVAFANSSGQLIVSSGDGGYRWIITNPGEAVAGTTLWSPRGDQLLFAVGSGGSASLRAANVSQQTISEIGQVGGEPLSLSSDGSTLFIQQPDGSYALQAINSGGVVALPLSNDLGARYSGLWSDAAPLVAYWGFAGNSQLAVTDAANAATITLDSGRTAPITPLAWRPGSTELVYRDASGFVRLADLACLQSTCGANPLETGAALLPAEVTDVHVTADWAFFRSGENIGAINLSCAAGNTCQNAQVLIANSAAPQTTLSVGRTTLVYTAYTQNANDINDREVRALDLNCLSSPSSCAPQTVLSGAVAGAISADARYAVVEQVNGGLSSLDLNTGAAAYLADKGASLAGARWQ